MKNILVILLLIVGCAPNSNEVNADLLEGRWLSGGIKLDKDYYRPYSDYMRITNSKITSRLSGTWRDTIQEITIRKDSIVFPYRTFGRDEVRIDGEEMILGKRYPRYYYKVSRNELELDSTQIRDTLLPGQWESRDEFFVFEDDSFIIYDKSKQTKNVYCWDLQSIDNCMFIQRKGSFNDCDYPYFSMQNISRLTKDSMTIQGWSKGEFITRTFIKSDASLSEFRDPEFRLCNPNLYANMNSDWYYFKYPQYEGGLYRLRQIYERQFVPVETGLNDGLLRVEFIINCVGEIGEFKLEELTFDYEKTSLNPLIGRQILNILENAGNWIPADSRNFQLDAYKFLIFKIRSGEIEEIYP